MHVSHRRMHISSPHGIFRRKVCHTSPTRKRRRAADTPSLVLRASVRWCEMRAKTRFVLGRRGCPMGGLVADGRGTSGTRVAPTGVATPAGPRHADPMSARVASMYPGGATRNPPVPGARSGRAVRHLRRGLLRRQLFAGAAGKRPAPSPGRPTPRANTSATRGWPTCPSIASASTTSST